jgi:hypothetical protein
MNKEIKARWVEALRSGNYEQGRYNLRQNNQFCCLGVLCDVVKDEVGCNWLPSQDHFSNLYKFDEADEILPIVVAEYADLQVSPRLEIATGVVEIANLNDSAEYSFEQLADLIEQQL